MKFPDHATVNAQTGFLLRKVSAASFSAFSKICGEHGLHPMHFGMLMMIDAEEPISQQELSGRTGIDPSSMVARMEALDDLGLVKRTRNIHDRRSYDVRLSATGRKLLEELRARADEHGDRFFSPLTKAERRELHELLLKLAVRIDEADGA